MTKNRVMMGVDPNFADFVRQEAEKVDLNNRQFTKRLANNQAEILEVLKNEFKF